VEFCTVVRAPHNWRRELAEITAAFDYLPKYFPTSHARDIYGSIWGGLQDPGNFHPWLHKRNSGVCVEVVTKEDVISERAEKVAESLASTTNASLVIGRMVGASVSSIAGRAGGLAALGATAGLAPAAIVGAVSRSSSPS
jgi:hypothetical protein